MVVAICSLRHKHSMHSMCNLHDDLLWGSCERKPLLRRRLLRISWKQDSQLRDLKQVIICRNTCLKDRQSMTNHLNWA
jgi:hypothetical protein